MSFLSVLLIYKIVGSILLVCTPFLFFSQEKLEKLTKVQSQNTVLFRLYGVAILSLLVGYAFALHASFNGQFPFNGVIMGLVSNGGASIVMLSQGAWKTSKLPAAFVTSVAMGLVIAMADQILSN